MEEKTIDEILDGLFKSSCTISCLSVKVYNLIREVGYGKITADNALHQMVEVYHDLSNEHKHIRNIAELVHTKGKAGKK